MHIHPDILEREKILYSLFNMRKKPNKKERNSIIGGMCNQILINYLYLLLICYLF